MAVVTQIDLTPGGPAVHVTVTDQAGTPLPPGEVTWDGPPAGVTITADASGFEFVAAAGTPATTDAATATYAGPRAPTPVAGPTLAVNIIVPVTALQYESP